MFERMRALFSLRNNRSNEAIDALCEGFSSTSALLRHELAYVLGQMQNNHAVPKLIEVLSDNDEHVMVSMKLLKLGCNWRPKGERSSHKIS